MGKQFVKSFRCWRESTRTTRYCHRGGIDLCMFYEQLWTTFRVSLFLDSPPLPNMQSRVYAKRSTDEFQKKDMYIIQTCEHYTACWLSRIGDPLSARKGGRKAKISLLSPGRFRSTLQWMQAATVSHATRVHANMIYLSSCCCCLFPFLHYLEPHYYRSEQEKKELVSVRLWWLLPPFWRRWMVMSDKRRWVKEN
jgi:hypothetical protein